MCVVLRGIQPTNPGVEAEGAGQGGDGRGHVVTVAPIEGHCHGRGSDDFPWPVGRRGFAKEGELAGPFGKCARYPSAGRVALARRPVGQDSAGKEGRLWPVDPSPGLVQGGLHHAIGVLGAVFDLKPHPGGAMSPERIFSIESASRLWAAA